MSKKFFLKKDDPCFKVNPSIWDHRSKRCGKCCLLMPAKDYHLRSNSWIKSMTKLANDSGEHFPEQIETFEDYCYVLQKECIPCNRFSNYQLVAHWLMVRHAEDDASFNDIDILCNTFVLFITEEERARLIQSQQPTSA